MKYAKILIVILLIFIGFIILDFYGIFISKTTDPEVLFIWLPFLIVAVLILIYAIVDAFPDSTFTKRILKIID